MIYFTDMLLIPGDGNPSRELRQALNGSGMVRCAQVEMQPDMVYDWDRADAENNAYWETPLAERKGVATPYIDEFAAKLKDLLSDRAGDLEWDSGGAWGGPGGSSEAWGVTKYEPEVSYVSGTSGGEVIVRVVGENPDMDGASDHLHDMVMDLGGDGHKVSAERVGETDMIRVYWDVDESWEPDGPDYDGPDDDDYDDPRSDYIYDPY